jgi:hypothetical protein
MISARFTKAEPSPELAKQLGWMAAALTRASTGSCADILVSVEVYLDHRSAQRARLSDECVVRLPSFTSEVYSALFLYYRQLLYRSQ